MDKILSKRISIKRENVAPYKLKDKKGYVFRAREKDLPQSILSVRKSSASENSGNRVQEARRISADPVADDDDYSTSDLGTNLMAGYDGECTVDLTAVDVYVNLLLAEDGVALSDNLGLVVYVREQRSASCLMEEYVVVCRRAFWFEDERIEWVFWCLKCHRNCIVPTLQNRLTVTLEEFEVPDCMHCKAASIIMKQHDAVHCILPNANTAVDCVTEFDHEYCFADNANIFSAYLTVCNGCEGHYAVGVCFPLYAAGVVIVKNSVLFCTTCHLSTCSHVAYLTGCSADIAVVSAMLNCVKNVGNSSNAGEVKASKNGCRSTKRISFESCNEVAESLRNLDLVSSNQCLIPEVENCPHCGAPMTDESLTEDIKVVGVTSSRILRLTVCNRACHNCQEEVYYDGSSDGLLNMTTYLVGHDILREYMHSFLHGKRPMHTFHKVLCDMHIDRGNIDIGKMFPYDNFRLAWLSYLKLLDINFDDGFSCPKCSKDGKQPNLIICDGTSLSFQRRMWQWKIADNGKLSKANQRQIRFEDRVFISLPELRKLLKRFAGGSRKLKQIFSTADKAKMLTLMESYCAELYNFVLLIGVNRLVAPEYACKFLLSLASTSPVCAYIPIGEKALAILSRIVAGENLSCDPNAWSNLQQLSPVLFDVLSKYGSAEIPVQFTTLLQVLIDKAIGIFADCVDIEEEPSDTTSDDSAFFPALPLLRNRSTYTTDKQQSGADVICGKTFRGHPTLLPGIFTIYCSHGICYGFKVMITHESPNVPFTILKTRFHEAPTTLVYDFACGLHKYCLNRDPTFFKNTVFLIDRLHWDNHTDCSPAYCLNSYPQLAQLNSQIVEQANAGLKRIKDQLSYMTAENFMNHCAFYLYNKNVQKLKRINADT